MKSITPKGQIMIFLILFLPLFSFCQTENLSSLMQKLTEQVGEVETKKYTYSQTVSFDAKFPYKATLEASRTDSKGKTKSQTLQFNLRDFDKNSIRRDNVKDVLVVKVNVAKKQRFISTSENGERGKYENELEMITQDVDNSRAIEDLLKKIIPLAKDQPPAAPLPASFEARIVWLEKNVIDAEKGGKFLGQKILKADGTRLTFEMEEERKKETEKNIYHFDLADLKGKKMRLEVKGKNVFLEISGREKFIRHEKNDELQNFKDDFKIYVKEDIELGKNIVKVFQDAIEDATKMVSKNTLVTNAKGGLSVKSVNDGKTIYTQKMEGGCEVTLETTYENKKGKTKTTKSVFHLDDLNSKSVEIKVSKKSLYINAKTENSKKLIQNFEDGDLENFSNKIEIRGSDVENIKELKKQLEANIAGCEGTVICSIGDTDPMSFVKKSVTDIQIGSKSFTQLLEPTDEENQWRFVQMQLKKKGGKEKAYVFNLMDIDPKKIDFEVSKKEVVIKMQTNKNEEIIKTYIDSEPDDYVKKFEILISDIPNARKLVCALKSKIEAL